ncbi:DUF2141 domain-containing protein [Mesonia maritima]|uniref:Uncharacterized protein (DUF2141 family) n=1 Tax=Mesonia maritima TaxID=1793873 RepID=A0ABU1K771_9FLAO|nr:DUF2141 domain-containing protein [Mesonia maritima]MDR6300867.1 uncharacterized protein (DUF2141 family) [Mesonia maritima]
MKTLFLLLMMACAKIVVAQETSTVTITIENITNDKGEILLGMYTEDNFLKAKPDFSKTAEIKDGKATVIFENVPRGTYGISCFHDENGNDQMDFEANGMPKEDYGISNNPTLYGPPEWNDAKFEVDENNESVSIRF